MGRTKINDYRLYKQAWVFNSDPHKESKLGMDDVSKLFSKGGLIVRNVYDFDAKVETSFWYVIKDQFGGYEELSSKMRNQVKRCFKTMAVKQVSSDYLLANGYNVYVHAFESYKVKSHIPSMSEFESRIKNAQENEFWGVFDLETNKLVAFSMNFVTDESCEYRTMKAIPEYQKKYAYYGLIFEMNKYYLEEKKLKYVNDGSRSITNHSNIQPFLIEKFNFRKAYCKLHIYYKWWIKLIIKIFYPLRPVILIRKLRYLLDMEAMARNQM